MFKQHTAFESDLQSLLSDLNEVTCIIAHSWDLYLGTSRSAALSTKGDGVKEDFNNESIESECTCGNATSPGLDEETNCYSNMTNGHDKFRNVLTLENKEGNRQLLKLLITKSCNQCQFPSLLVTENEGNLLSKLDSADFHESQEVTMKLFKCCDMILDKLSSNKYSQPVGQFLPVCSLCSLICDHSEHNVWTSAKITEIGNNILQKIIVQSNSKSVSDLLTRECVDMQCHSDRNVTIISTICKEFSKKLTRESWKNNIPTVYKYKFCLISLRFPHFTEHLNELLPTALILIDDFQVQYKVMGVQCLAHIMKNCSRTEMQWHGRAKVIYDALWHLTYSKDSELVTLLYPCLFDALKLLENPPREITVSKKYGLYDKCLAHLLTNMELENNLELRRKYSYHLTEILQLMGITAVRHLPRLLGVVQTYLDIYDGPLEVSRQHALQTLSEIIVQLWPRIPVHACTIFQMLVKFAIDIHLKDSLTPVHVRNKLSEKIKEIIKMLRKSNEVIIQKAIKELVKLELNADVQKMLQETVVF